jgi:GTP cyclohydrolase I
MPSPKSPFDKDRITAAVREILIAIGEDPDREGLRETPHRIAKMYQELFSGLHEDPATYTKKFFSETYNEVVLVRDISFSSMCEHHLMPFMGVVHIGYIPDGRVIGLSKLARVIEVFSHRPQIQERMTSEIAELLYRELDAKAVAVVIEAEHTCMTLRGVNKPGSLCLTSALRGGFLKNPSSRAEILSLINKR